MKAPCFSPDSSGRLGRLRCGAAASARPNFVFLLADDHADRAYVQGAAGNTTARTAILDQARAAPRHAICFALLQLAGMHSIAAELFHRPDAPHGGCDAPADAARGRQAYVGATVEEGRIHDGRVRQDAFHQPGVNRECMVSKSRKLRTRLRGTGSKQAKPRRPVPANQAYPSRPGSPSKIRRGSG